MLTKDQFAQLYNSGLSVDQIKMFDSGLTPADITSMNQPVGGFQSFAQSVASPFLKLASSIGEVGTQAKGIFQQITGDTTGSAETQKQVEKMKNYGVDYGYLGRVKPLGATGSTTGDLKESLGTGLEVGSYIVPGSFAKGVVKTGLKGALVKGTVGGLTAGATGGAMMGLGQSLQDQNAGVLQTIINTGAGATFGGVGGGILGAVTPLASKVIQSPIAKLGINKIMSGIAPETALTRAEQDVLNSKQQIVNAYQDSIPLSPSQKIKEQNLLQRTGDNVYSTLVKHDINVSNPNAIAQLQDVSNLFSDATSRAQQQEGALFNINEARQNALNEIDSRLQSEVARDQAKAKVNAEIDAVLNSSKEQLQSGANGEVLAPSDVMERLRKIGNELTPFNASDPQKIGRSAGYALADAIRTQVEKQGTFPAYRDAMREWGKIIHAQEVMQDLADSGKTFKLPGMFGGLSGSIMRKVLSGGLGFHTGGVGGAVLAEIGSETAAKVLANPDLRTYLDKLLIQNLTKGKSAIPEIITKLNSQIDKELERRATVPKLPPASTKGTKENPFVMVDPTQYTPAGGVKAPQMSVVPAEKGVPVRNPKTGRFETNYLSTPKSPATTIEANMPINNEPIKANINQSSNIPNGKSNLPVDKSVYGGIAGIEIKTDENGKTTISFNPEKALAGMIGMVSAKAIGPKLYVGVSDKVMKSMHPEDIMFLKGIREMFSKGLTGGAKEEKLISDMLGKLKISENQTPNKIVDAIDKFLADKNAVIPPSLKDKTIKNIKK